MSVDDAFRQLMQQESAGAPPPPASLPPPAPAPQSSPATVDSMASATVEAPAAPLPTRARIPDAKPLDLSKIPVMKRFGHDPVDSRSQVAEEYRILRTRLQSLDLDRPSMLLTSCHHDEGKSSTALNLSLSMAKRRSRKILLVDMDLRRPRIDKMLGLPRMEYDIVSVLRGYCEPEEAMVYSEEEHLYVLPACRQYSNGTDFLETADARNLIERLHATFDFVVIDSCPCLSTSDPAIIGPYVGGVAMVIRCLRTQRESITHAINSLEEVGVPVVGVILTYLKYFLPRYLYRYQYYHGQYYASYAYGDREPRESNLQGDAANAEAVADLQEADTQVP